MDKAIYRNTKSKTNYDPDHRDRAQQQNEYPIYKMNIVQIKPVICNCK